MKISVIVPVRDEERSIRALLDGLLAQTRPPDEIVITDGGSSDATPSIIENYIKRGAPIQLIRTQAALPGRGRNLAAQNASSEWLAFTDAGVRAEDGWLAALAAEVDDGIDVIYGAWEPITDSLFKECAAIAYVSPPTEQDGAFKGPPSIASSLVRRSVWQAVGGFPEHLRSAEDLLFMNEVERAGFRIAYTPKALVRWELQPNFRRTFKRFVKYSRHNIRAGLWRSWQAPLFRRYAFILLLALPAFILGWRWLAVALALWLLLICGRALTALWRNRRQYPAGLSRQALRLLVIVPLIMTLDAAGIVGSLHWVVADKLNLRSPAVGIRDGA